jgi:hypothetical protein
MTAEMEIKIENAHAFIEHITTPAYRNKIIKEEEGLKNKGEEVVFLITEQNYEKYTKDKTEETVEEKIESFSDEENLINTMTVYEKWVYFLFKKDTR